MSAVHVNDENFQTEVLESKLPVLVDFWATWCNPCRMIAPVVEELSDEYDGKIVIAKLDVDEAGDTAEAYGVMSIPTLIVFKQGAEKERIVGLRPKAELAELIKKYI